MLDWIFEGIVGWVSSVVTQLMDAVSGLFLSALGTDMLAMEEYFPFVGNQGLFPKYDAGIYTEGNTNMVVSRGVGNSIIPFRINNRPEVIIIELTTEGDTVG